MSFIENMKDKTAKASIWLSNLSSRAYIGLVLLPYNAPRWLANLQYKAANWVKNHKFTSALLVSLIITGIILACVAPEVLAIAAVASFIAAPLLELMSELFLFFVSRFRKPAPSNSAQQPNNEIELTNLSSDNELEAKQELEFGDPVVMATEPQARMTSAFDSTTTTVDGESRTVQLQAASTEPSTPTTASNRG